MEKHIKVLIVDDELPNLQVMQQILYFHPQYDCRVASSGEEALRVLVNFLPEIILLDVMMPGGMNGYEVCERIRAQPIHRLAKIIMVSGMSLIDDRLKGYGAGADDYLTKPYVEAELLAKLEVYSKLKRMEEVDNLKTMALNILSHETRTPLNGIIMGSELLRDMEELPEKAKQYVEMIRASGVRIQELVNKISRYYAVKDGLDKQMIEQPLAEFLSSVFKDLRAGGQPVSVIIGTTCDQRLMVSADPQLIREALVYLFDNIQEYGKVGQEIPVECREEASSLVMRIGGKESLGTSSSTQRVFDGLFSVDLLHHGSGTGLGLAIAKEIVEEHDGQITCFGPTKEETAFEIVLPARKML